MYVCLVLSICVRTFDKTLHVAECPAVQTAQVLLSGFEATRLEEAVYHRSSRRGPECHLPEEQQKSGFSDCGGFGEKKKILLSA